jgi:uncharacterized protein (DUF433 family)
MSIDIQANALPLRTDESGGFRIGKTRIPLERVIHEFQKGETPEMIVESFDTLSLCDVYTLIGYYLRHRKEVEEYLAERQRYGDAMQERIMRLLPGNSELRARVKARRQAKA